MLHAHIKPTSSHKGSGNGTVLHADSRMHFRPPSPAQYMQIHANAGVLSLGACTLARIAQCTFETLRIIQRAHYFA